MSSPTTTSPYGPVPGQRIGQEESRGRPFYPGDNAQDLSTVDWKSRYDELKRQRNWDPQKQFWGLPRLGDRYHVLEPFFKFEGTPKHMQTFDKIWWPTIGGTAGFLVTLYYLSNGPHKRPPLASLPVYVGMTALGIGFGWLALKRSEKMARDRDAVLIHYGLLHENELPTIGMYCDDRISPATDH